jgi:glycosyltransferase involved in cell wall biosynthesis
MKNDHIYTPYSDENKRHKDFSSSENLAIQNSEKLYIYREKKVDPIEILFISSYPPRECGIATYSQDLIKSIENKFSQSISIKVCAMESGETNYAYPEEVKYILKTSIASEYEKLAGQINRDPAIKIVLIQHEFGFFHVQEQAFQQLIAEIKKPVVVVFHTVLPNPNEKTKQKIKHIAAFSTSIIVMTHTSADILTNAYGVSAQLITVIAHGTHLVPHINEKILKSKYGLLGRKVLTTFGLLSSGKSLETTINALPAIIEECPETLFLIMGKTHPEVVKNDGEKYREMLHERVEQLELQNHVKFINKYLDLPELLDYLQLTDIYIFSSNDPNQAVSGTFAYAMSCGCPIISTPIPHAKEILNTDTGIIFDFNDSGQLAKDVIKLLNDDELRKHLSTNALQKIVSSAWENSAVLHANLLSKISGYLPDLKYNLPAINLNHLRLLTTNTGMIQFSKINQPDIESGYTLDDNARALVAMCLYYKTTSDKEALSSIQKYLSFISICQQPEGNFINYIDQNNQITNQNNEVNLDDSNGRAIWALGYASSLKDIIPIEITRKAKELIEKARKNLQRIHSTRSMAFAIKGIYFYQQSIKSAENLQLIKLFADRMVQMYKHESDETWNWFESYLTYGNTILPEAMLYAWLITGDNNYKDVAHSSFNFILSKTFNENGIEVISNKKWLQKGQEQEHFGEQPIDVSYTMMTLSMFYEVFHDDDYRLKMIIAFNWFLGSNRLSQIIYNPCTGGCYDGLEENHVNLNQGAESTVSYLLARLTIEKYVEKVAKYKLQKYQKKAINTYKQIKCSL